MAPPELTSADLARIEMAAELRRGMHLLVGREPSEEVLRSATEAIRSHFDQLAGADVRVRGGAKKWNPVEDMVIPADGELLPDSLDRPVSGSGNPFSIPMRVRRDGDGVTATVTLGDGFEGAPGRSHGGFVSAIFDDLLGSLPLVHGMIAFTATLTVNYLAPSPVHEPVTFRGWIDRIEGKKIFVEGESRHGDVVVTTASALFIDATDLIMQAHDPSRVEP